MTTNAAFLEQWFGNLNPAKYSPGTVANWFLMRSKQNSQYLTQMQLQKLMYFAHGWTLALQNAPLIKEPAEAWQYGPVFPSVYHGFKQYGRGQLPNGVDALMQEPMRDSVTGNIQFKSLIPNPQDATTQQLLEEVWGKYASFSGEQLSNMTHYDTPENPWKITYAKALEKQMTSVDIPNTFIKRYFDILRTENRLY